ncbi:HEAT repeat domain-containing protein [Salinilacihabitans rarus]|uniref:HEAT repeat domain-containing protein n=1 Tax=Salinilacihabitans rarus TaxID=2961596 RepID=UPI0020C92084|nr:HEAT repeat domain-containing protein [Salinilacihabitans rarus]
MSDDPEGPPDAELAPTRSPGFGADAVDLSEIEVSREVTLGTADPAAFTATDTEPVAGATVAELRAALRSADRIERRRAAVALSKHPPTDEAVEPIATAALEDPDAEVRQFAVEALATHADETALTAVEAAASDEDPWVRAEAVVTLDAIDRDGARDVIEAKLDDDHPAVRRNAMISVYRARPEDAIDTLLSGLDDPAERVREYAAELLGGLDDDRARRALATVAAEDESALVRATADRALGGAGTPAPGGHGGRSPGTNRDRTSVPPGDDVDGDDLNRSPDL